MQNSDTMQTDSGQIEPAASQKNWLKFETTEWIVLIAGSLKKKNLHFISCESMID
jgi:hypothetical protein